MSHEFRKPDDPETAAGGDAAADAAPASDAVRLTRNNTGRVTFDDRGNAIWEWAMGSGSLSPDGPTARSERLAAAPLEIAEDPPPRNAGAARPTPKSAAHGYSPYDSGLIDKPEPARKKTDLRRLSEFYKLKQQASRNKRDD